MAVSLAAVLAFSSVTEAKENIPLLFKKIALQEQVPAELLYAIARQESYDPSRKKIWPWTINFHKKGYYFPTRQAAYNAVQLLHKNNIHSVDIGLMQTNWRWQKDRLKSTWKAFDPAFNIRIGAQILRDCYDIKNSWWVCTGRYHSPGQNAAQIKRAENYRKLIYTHLKRVTS